MSYHLLEHNLLHS